MRRWQNPGYLRVCLTLRAFPHRSGDETVEIHALERKRRSRHQIYSSRAPRHPRVRAELDSPFQVPSIITRDYIVDAGNSSLSGLEEQQQAMGTPRVASAAPYDNQRPGRRDEPQMDKRGGHSPYLCARRRPLPPPGRPRAGASNTMTRGFGRPCRACSTHRGSESFLRSHEGGLRLVEGEACLAAWQVGVVGQGRAGGRSCFPISMSRP